MAGSVHPALNFHMRQNVSCGLQAVYHDIDMISDEICRFMDVDIWNNTKLKICMCRKNRREQTQMSCVAIAAVIRICLTGSCTIVCTMRMAPSWLLNNLCY